MPTDDPWYAWSITRDEAPHHPAVRRLVKGQPCDGFMSKTSWKAIAEGRAPKCKNVAHWRFRALRRCFIQADSGVYCWTHLISRGVVGNMDEEARTVRWLKKWRNEQ